MSDENDMEVGRTMREQREACARLACIKRQAQREVAKLDKASRHKRFRQSATCKAHKPRTRTTAASRLAAYCGGFGAVVTRCRDGIK